MFPIKSRVVVFSLLALVSIPAFAAVGCAKAAGQTVCIGAFHAGTQAPRPADPYPLMAAGWGPELGDGLFVSRWAEDWAEMSASARVPALKAIAVGQTSLFTLNAEVRLRHAISDPVAPSGPMHFAQTQLRAVAGAKLTLNPHVYAYAEIGSGHVDGEREAAAANFENRASLQQFLVDVRGHVGSVLVGAMAGRQEFSDGPRQLISLSDGPNLHRTWNGVRLYAHGTRHRFGAFDLRASRLGRGAFDEKVNPAEKLQGLNASLVVSEAYLEPFWFHSEMPEYRIGDRSGLDDRHTFGVRLWGRRGNARFDWTAAHQVGRTMDNHRIDAWALFAVQSLALSESDWKPRLTSHVDVASGGASGSGTVHGFNPLYASSGYLGEGRFLGLSNLMILAPGVAVAPTARTSFSLEYGYARRLDGHDAVHAGGSRIYASTQNVAGRHIGNLIRLGGTWSVNQHVSLRFDLEHLAAGSVLRNAGFPSGTYTYLDTTYRY